MKARRQISKGLFGLDIDPQTGEVVSKTILAALALVLAGCSSLAETPSQMMALPVEQIIETKVTAAVPLKTAYRNVLERMRQCWQEPYKAVDPDPYDEDIGFARIALRGPPATFQGSTVFRVIELRPASQTSTLLIGRSMTYMFDPAIEKLQRWAEGKDLECS